MTTPDADDVLRLDQFLKLQRLVQTGGHAKFVIQNGEVLVNGEVETRRRRKLKPADRVEFDGQTRIVPPQDGAAAEDTK